MKLLITALLVCSFSLAQAQVYTADAKGSTLQWTGYYLFSFGEHTGTIDLLKGTLTVEDGQVNTGTFDIDMRSLKSIDMKDEEDGGKSLTDHLMSDDFFSADKFPVATFEITRTEKINEAKPGRANYEVFGFLTLKGVRNEISFPAIIQAEKNTVTAKGRLKFDRTRWDIKYESSKFFSELGNSAISDAIAIDFNIKAIAKP